MTSTELKIGLTGSARPSTRVLKPPGGGHTNIFSEPEMAVNAPRRKYNQQTPRNLTPAWARTKPTRASKKLREE
ncbi:uncharacterized protein Dana_GF27393, partial [Drosophila ananassae]